MKALLIQLDDHIAAKLERFAPAKKRQRTKFIREAILRSIWAIEERLTEEAYRRIPDSAEDIYFDPNVWESAPAPEERKRRRRTSKP